MARRASHRALSVTPAHTRPQDPQHVATARLGRTITTARPARLARSAPQGRLPQPRRLRARRVLLGRVMTMSTRLHRVATANPGRLPKRDLWRALIVRWGSSVSSKARDRALPVRLDLSRLPDRRHVATAQLGRTITTSIRARPASSATSASTRLRHQQSAARARRGKRTPTATRLPPATPVGQAPSRPRQRRLAAPTVLSASPVGSHLARQAAPRA